MTSPLTLARDACWKSIENYAPLNDGNGNSVFRHLMKFDERNDVRDEIEPSIGQMPALALLARTTNITWKENQAQQWAFTLQAMLWTKGWTLPDAEKYSWLVVKAVYTEGPSAGISWVKHPTGTGFHPMSAGDITFTPTRIGADRNVRAMFTTVNLQLRIKVNPFN